MVGNLIKLPDGRVGKTLGIEGGYVHVRVNDYVGAISIPLGSVSPIPIAEEWLTKNGFENRYNICYEKEIEAYYVEISKESNMGDEYVHCHVDNCDRCTIGCADIRYVHQLQNLLNLLEIEWEVKI